MGNEYYKKYIEQLMEINRGDNKRPILLFHVCCGACSIYPLISIVDLFKIKIFFTNSNIYPYDEFNRRLSALKKHVEFVNKTFNADIEVIVDEYDYESFKMDLIPYKDEKEGMHRCKICIYKRMKRLFLYARSNNIHYVSTVMSISRNKDTNYLNEIGKILEKDFKDIEFIYTDFKKNDGQDLCVEISKLEEIYRQDYCACEFSKINQ